MNGTLNDSGKWLHNDTVSFNGFLWTKCESKAEAYKRLIIKTCGIWKKIQLRVRVDEALTKFDRKACTSD